MLLRGEDLAKGWLLAMLEDAPLDEAAAILAGDVSRDGPRICEAVVRAVSDESDLRRIEPGGVLEPLVSRVGELGGARTAEAAAHAVDVLRAVVWSALDGELARTDPDLLADAGERLSLIAELIRAAVLRRRGNGEAGPLRTPRMAPLRVAREDAPGHVRAPEPPVAEPPVPQPPAATAEPTGGEAERVEAGGEPVGAGGAPVGAGTAPVGAGAEGPGGEPEAPDESMMAETVRDALWIGALRDEIVRAGRARMPLSLLLVELEEADRVLAVEPQSEAAATFGRFAQAVRTALRRRDVLACETDSRAWVIARDTGRAGAQALGARIVTAVPSEESWRGAPLTVSVGLAVLGEDGHNAAALIDAAEQTKFAAEASGIGIVTDLPGEGGAEPPPTPGPSLVS
jgi:GGDEF domain-containing protein